MFPKSSSEGDDTVTDEELMEAYLAGDADSIGILLKRLLPRLGAITRKHFSNAEQANDALQEGIEAIIKKAKSFRGESKVFTWMYTIVAHTCIDIYRREASRTRLNTSEDVLIDIHDKSADFTERTDAHVIIHQALGKLAEDQRMAIVLVDLEGRSVGEAAEILGVAEGTIKSRCSRGRMELAQILKDPVREPGTNAEDISSKGMR
jgi:RNA polymerase sigma-70 factor (ECF subfamily)